VSSRGFAGEDASRFFQRWREAAPGACAAMARALGRRPQVPWGSKLELGALADALEREVARRQGDLERPGWAWFPVVLERPRRLRGVPGLEGVRGYLSAVWAGGAGGGEPAPEGFEPLDPAAASKVRAWVASAAAMDEGDVDGFELWRKPAAPETAIRGDSYEAAAAMALVSAILEQRPRSGVVVSATLGGGGAWEPIREVESKRRIVETEQPASAQGAILVHGEPEDGVRRLASLFGDDWAERVAVRVRAAPSALGEEAARLLGAGEFGAAVYRAQRVAGLDTASALDQARAQRVLGEVSLHRGDTDQGLARLERARDLFDVAVGEAAGGRSARPRLLEREQARVRLAVAWIDALRGQAATRELARASDELLRVPSAYRSAEWVLVSVEAAGTLSRALLLQGDLAQALDAQRRAHELARGSLPAERARCLMDLADLHRRAGRLNEAREHLARARRALRDIPFPKVRERTGRFLRLYELRAGLREPSWSPAPPSWARWPQPAESLEALLARPLGDLDGWMRAHLLASTVHAGPVFLLLALSTCARAAVRHGEVPPAVPLLAQRLAAALGEHPTEDAATHALAELAQTTAQRPLDLGEPPLNAWVVRCPY